MKLYYILLLVSIIPSCDDSYEKEEFKAIEDISNDFLIRNHLESILNPILAPPPPGDTSMIKSPQKPNISTLNLKIYLSDALMPIAQIKEDNKWMFEDNYQGHDSVTFYNILMSERFSNLEYREFEKHKIDFIKPYRYFYRSNENFGDNDSFIILKFSRVCFDKEMKFGIVVFEAETGFKDVTTSGIHKSLLIKKENDKWSYIE